MARHPAGTQQPRHRKPGDVGSFTVHAPADYQPKHRRAGTWVDGIGRPATVYTPPEDWHFRPSFVVVPGRSSD